MTLRSNSYIIFSQIIEPDEVHKKTGMGAPHTTHCLGSGEVMISMIGDHKGDATKSQYIRSISKQSNPTVHSLPRQRNIA